MEIEQGKNAEAKAEGVHETQSATEPELGNIAELDQQESDSSRSNLVDDPGNVEDTAVYSAISDNEDPGDQSPTKKETPTPQAMDNDARVSSGWSNGATARPAKSRRETWDTSFIGRLIVWLIFFTTMFLFTFLIPYLLMDKDATPAESGAAHDAAREDDSAVVAIDLSEDELAFNGASRMENIQSVILQSGITSEETLQDEMSDAYQAARWLSETDPAQVVPLVNHHDNTPLLQRYALAVLYYASQPFVDAAGHSQGIPQEKIEHVLPHDDPSEADSIPQQVDSPSESAGPGWFLPAQPNPSPSPASTGATPPTVESPTVVQSAHLEHHDEKPQSVAGTAMAQNATQSAHFEDHGAMTQPGDPILTAGLERSGKEPRVVRVERNEHDRRLDDSESLEHSWLEDASWMTSVSVCDWYGITCDEGTSKKDIVGLNLTSNLLKGTIPSEILALSKLTSVDLSHNKLTGRIPANVWKRLPLTHLMVNGNQLSGSIHSDLERTTTLEILDLSNNQLTGTIPTIITNLRHLRALRLEENKLSGTIPPMAELTSLNVMRLGGNSLTGSTPIHVFLLKKLVDLGLQRNSLTGTFPPEVDSLQFLQTLDLSGNRIDGDLPEVFLRLHALKSLNLGDNQFSLKVPTSLGFLNKLEKLDLSSNGFEGSIPEEWSGMTSLVDLALDQNEITGTIPTGMLRRMTSLQAVNLDSNKMTGTLPVELGSLSNLKTLTLSANSFSGVIPEQLGTIASLEILELSESSLTGSMPLKICEATESGSLIVATADCAKIRCECCTNCDAPEAG